MSYTLDDYQRDSMQRMLDRLTPKHWAEIFKQLPVEQQLAVFKTLPAKEVEQLLEPYKKSKAKKKPRRK